MRARIFIVSMLWLKKRSSCSLLTLSTRLGIIASMVD